MALTLAELSQRPTITVPEAADILGISRESAYKAARAGELPVLMLGRRMVVPTAPLVRLLTDAHAVAQ